MNRKEQSAVRRPRASDALPIDMLKSIVGGAGLDRKQDLTAERAMALTAGAAEPAPPAEGKPLETKNQTAEIEKALRGDSGLMKPAASISKDIYKLTKTLVGEGSDQDAVTVKHGKWEGAADKHQKTIEKADKGHVKAQEETRAAADKLAEETAAAEKNAKLRAEVKAAEAELKKAQERPAAGKAETVKAQEERLAKAKDAVKDLPSEKESEARVKAAGEALDKAKATEGEAKAKADTYAGRTAAVKAAEAAHGAAQDQVKTATQEKVAAEKNAKLWADVKAAEADLKKAQERPAAGKAAETVKWQEERLAKAREAVKNLPSEKESEARVKAAGEALDKAKATESKAKGHADDIAARDLKAGQNEALKQQDRDSLKTMARDQGYGKAVSLTNDILHEIAKEDARAKGTYHKQSEDKVLAGGVSSTTETSVQGGKVVTETVKKVGQVKTEAATESYSGTGAKGANASWTARAEAGVEKTTREVDPKTGKEITTTHKAYAGAAFENKAKVEVSATKVAVEASTQVVAHAEASTAKGIKVGIVEAVGKIGVSADAQAGAKAGASLGFDGVKIGASAEASVTAKASASGEVKVGNVEVKNTVEVYATAKASAKANADVNFNPFTGEKVGVKVGVGAEAAAGVGIQDTLSLGKNVEVGGGVYAGKIGAKADVDVGVKDGKVNIGVDVGAALGVGVSVKFKVQVDVAGNAKNIGADLGKAADTIKNGNVLQKAGGVFTFGANVVASPFRLLFG